MYSEMQFVGSVWIILAIASTKNILATEKQCCNFAVTLNKSYVPTNYNNLNFFVLWKFLNIVFFVCFDCSTADILVHNNKP